MTYGEIIDLLGNEIISVTGNVPREWELRLADSDHVDGHVLDWCQQQNILRISAQDYGAIIKVHNAKSAIAKVGNKFLFKQESGVSPTAQIESGAQIGKDCYIGPNVVIKSCVTIGSRVRINANSVIGNSGFGFVRDENGNLIRFPQLGKVIIGDDVEIGSCVTIDRGALSDTVIDCHSKINNLVHIAHNVHIGENVVVTAHVNISGSSIIGNNVWIGPGTTVRDHVNIGQGAYIGIGSNVVKNIPPEEVWCGNPAKKMR